MIGLIRPNGAVILLGLLCALAVVECMAAFMDYRERIEARDWVQIEELVATHADAPVIVGSEWLGPSARMHLAGARGWDALAYPDLRYADFWLLSHMLERPWSGPLKAELEELPRPELVEVHRVGDLSLRRYTQVLGAQRFSLLDSIAKVRTPRGNCRGSRGQWSCKEGRVALRTLEIDYRPRRCLALELDDGVVAQVDLGELELGEQIRGHVGFGDFNARLRADPIARVELLIDGAIVARWLFSDDQGWAAFALKTPSGRHRVELRASGSVGGTWQRGAHENQPTNALCIELRGFAQVEAEANP